MAARLTDVLGCSGFSHLKIGNSTRQERHQALQKLPAQDPNHTISAVAKEALLATFKLFAHRKEEAAVVEKADAYPVEADKAELALGGNSSLGDMAMGKELQSFEPPMPLAPGSSSAKQEMTTPKDNKKDIIITWDALVMATADFAAAPAERQAWDLLEDETSSIFGNDNDPELQNQERQRALEMRAAAAAAQGAQNKISAEEVQALRAKGKALREAAAAERAAQLQKADAALQELTEIERGCYFEAEVCSNEADTQVQVSDKREDSEVLALVEGLARLRALESGQ